MLLDTIYSYTALAFPFDELSILTILPVVCSLHLMNLIRLGTLTIKPTIKNKIPIEERDRGTTIIVVSHDREELDRIADVQFIMGDGRIREV